MTIIPNEADRATVHTIIYDELCHSKIVDASRREYQRIIDAMKAQGAQGVILGCTEITLLIQAGDASLPVFDATRLHAHAAIENALH